MIDREASQAAAIKLSFIFSKNGLRKEIRRFREEIFRFLKDEGEVDPKVHRGDCVPLYTIPPS
jgi:hypothetical protein